MSQAAEGAPTRKEALVREGDHERGHERLVRHRVKNGSQHRLLVPLAREISVKLPSAPHPQLAQPHPVGEPSSDEKAGGHFKVAVYDRVRQKWARGNTRKCKRVRERVWRLVDLLGRCRL